MAYLTCLIVVISEITYNWLSLRAKCLCKHRACVKLYCVHLSLLTDDHLVRFPIYHLRSWIFLFFGTPFALSGYVGAIEVITHWCFIQHFSKLLPGSYSLSFSRASFRCHVCVSVYSTVSADPVVSCGWGAYHEFILWHYSSPPPQSNRSLGVMSYSAQALSWYIFAWTGFEASIQQNSSFVSKLRGGNRDGNGILHSIFTMYYGQPVFVLSVLKICSANDWLTPCFSHRSLLFMIPLLQQ